MRVRMYGSTGSPPSRPPAWAVRTGTNPSSPQRDSSTVTSSGSDRRARSGAIADGRGHLAAQLGTRLHHAGHGVGQPGPGRHHPCAHQTLAAVQEPRIVERYHTQLATFGWPAGQRQCRRSSARCRCRRSRYARSIRRRRSPSRSTNATARSPSGHVCCTGRDARFVLCRWPIRVVRQSAARSPRWHIRVSNASITGSTRWPRIATVAADSAVAQRHRITAGAGAGEQSAAAASRTAGRTSDSARFTDRFGAALPVQRSPPGEGRAIGTEWTFDTSGLRGYLRLFATDTRRPRAVALFDPPMNHLFIPDRSPQPHQTPGMQR